MLLILGSHVTSLAGPPLDTQVRALVTGSKVRDIMDGLPDEIFISITEIDNLNYSNSTVNFVFFVYIQHYREFNSPASWLSKDMSP